MNQQKNQAPAGPGFLEGLQGEVSAENAPLLDFITRYAGWIAGAVLLLLLVLGGMALWNWHHGGKLKETQAELARINMDLKGAERNRALEALAASAPAGMKLPIYLSLAQSALSSDEPALAADAYAKAADLDGDGPLGMTAALGVAGSLLVQGEYGKALALLQEFGQKYPEAAQSPQLREMTAEAAANAGKLELAREIYAKLAQDSSAPESAYFQSRSESLAAQITAQKPKGK